MVKNPTIEELEDCSRFKKELSLSYEDVAVFVMNHLKATNPAMIVFWIVTIVSFVINTVLWIFALKMPMHRSMISGAIIGYIFIPILLAPVHEFIHYLFLKLSGARDVRLGMDLRQGIIYLSAHRHVIGKSIFKVIATAPFVILTLTLFICIILSLSPWLKWVISSVLLIHSTMCIGDLVLLGYMQEFRPHSVYTWDDVDAKEAFFYVSSDGE